MRLVALYKTFQGEEFVDSSIESIYNHVDKIFFLHSDISWLGETGNTVRVVVDDWAIKSDACHKIVSIQFDTKNQNEQYDKGLSVIREYGYINEDDFILLIDTDEVWDNDNIERLKARLVELPKITMSVACKMHTYIKSPFFRLDPEEPCQPTIIVRATVKSISGCRGNGVKPKVVMPDIKFHHFTYVRDSEEKVFAKIKSSTFADGASLVDLDKWIKTKWDKLPDCTDFHTSKGYEHYWKGIKRVTKDDLPEVFQLQTKPIIRQFEYEEHDIVERHKKSYEIIKTNPHDFDLEYRRQTPEYGLLSSLMKSIDKSKTILEIGCLMGHNLILLAQDGFKNLTGIELIPEAAVWGKETSDKLGLKVKIIEGIYPEAVHPNHIWDVIIVFDVLEHVPNPGFFLTSIKKNLHKNGHLFILVPKGENFYDPVHINFYPSVESFRNMLKMYFSNLSVSEFRDGKKLLARIRND